MKILFFLFMLSSCSLVVPDYKPKDGIDSLIVVRRQAPSKDLKLDAQRANFALKTSGFKKGAFVPVTFNMQNNPKCLRKKKCNEDMEWITSTHLWLVKESKRLGGHIPVCGLDPRSRSWKKILKDCFDIGMKAVKIHTVSAKFELKDSKNFNHLVSILKEIEYLRLPVIFHGYFPDQKDEAIKHLELIEKFPKIRFALAHMLGKDLSLLKGKKFSNLYLEVSASIFWYFDKKEELRKTFYSLGIDRILFGSDWPIFHPSEIMWALSKYEFSKDELAQMTKTNAEQFFNL